MSQLPGVNSRTINDLVPYVQDALQNRADVTTAVATKYIKRAIQELTQSYPIEELRITGPTVVLTIQQSIYPVTAFLNANDDYTQIPSMGIYVDFPTNTVVSPLKYKTPAAIEVMIAPATQGLPSRWTRFGQNIFIGPTPNATYSMFMRYQRRHPFPDDETQLSSQQLFFGNTWEEIVAYGAAERIAIVKRWTDQAKFLHDILFGDPEFQVSGGKRGRPGLLEARTHQIERDQQNNERQIMPLVSRYNPR